MSIGELWIAHPLFPWIMITLALWVACSTIVMVRNWALICRLERHNKLLQEMLVAGIRNVAKQIRSIQDRIPILKPVRREEKRTSELCSGETGIRTEEQPAPEIEETNENGDDLAATESENAERESVRST